MNRTLATVLVALLLLLPVRGQQPSAQQPTSPPSGKPSTAPTQNPQRDEQDDVVRIRTNLVQVDAVVTKDGKQVTDLTADDFEIFEDERPQTITNFSYISNVPSPSTIAAATPEKNKNASPVLPAAIRPRCL